jgi:3',5'-nucleoside bisphosphate phosphatase
MDFRADLHCHSTYSDGSLSPEELLVLAHEVGLQGISITDHDTVDGYSEELFALARSLKIELLVGVEISSQWEEESIHILGYGFDLHSKHFRDFLEEIQQKRRKRNLGILAKLNERGMILHEEELLKYAQQCNRGHLSSVGRPHIAALLKEKGYVTSYLQAFHLYLKDGGCCYVQSDKYSSQEVIQQIHEAKGKAILAHPHQIIHKRVLKMLFELSFDGIEGNDVHRVLPEQQRWICLAKKKGWIVTGGSDFHGKERSYVSLGSVWICKEVFDQLKNASLS